MIAGHSVDTSPRWGGCTTEIKIGPWCAVERARRTEQDLLDIHSATQEIAANQIWVPALKRSRRRDGSGQNAIAKIGCETCDLAFDRFGIVLLASVRYVAVSPSGMLADGSSTRVEKGRLAEEDKWPCRRESSFRIGNLL